MALKAGYYGVKKQVLDELNQINGILPSDASASNKLATQAEIDDIWKANGVLGAKNLLQSIIQSRTYNTSCVVTVRDDGSFNVNGLNDDASFISVEIGTFTEFNVGDKFIVSGSPSGSSVSSYSMLVVCRNSGGQSTLNFNVLADEVVFTIPENTVKVQVYLRVEGNVTVPDKDFYPMIRLVEDIDNSFKPYSLTNKQLSEMLKTNILSEQLQPVVGLTAYEFSFVKGYRIGNLVNIVLIVKSLTENANPAGRAYIDVLTGMPSPITDYNVVIASGSGGNALQASISGTGTPKLQMRGGTTDATYYINLFYICDEPVLVANRSLEASAPDTREITDEPVVEKKTTTKKTTKKSVKVEEE